MLSSLMEWLWQDKFWLAPNSTWDQMEDRDGLVFAHPRHMLPAVPLALALVAVRLIFERFVGLPLGRWMGVRDQIRRHAKPNATLEKHFRKTGRRPKEAQMALLATQCGLTLRQTQRWFRRRRNQERPRLSKKFCEASWKFAFYLCSFTGGISILYHEPWMWTVKKCWENYPQQTLQPELYWWYLLELSFYISLLITLPFDIKRKDFSEQVIHHFVTITLLSFSYFSNLLRIGSLVLLLHDSADYLLEVGKMLSYAGYGSACTAVFFVFSAVFFFTRLIIFPTQIIYSTWFESIENSGPFFAYYFFNALLMMLQVLHIYWFCLILRMIYNVLGKGQVGSDVRSDAEESDSTDDEVALKGPQLKNGVIQGPGTEPSNGPRNRAAGRLANGHIPTT
ncbi:ceramide synthase 4 [Perognathus longimembris pacificus]|uniref:ceramide synthase 4 n=1 Tax=Perognathus longimembris pacificus TaxID=214514 RepID=UPI00201A0119|nr:ceramide synthase 4 [Perognathus longimembris pacificus]